MPDLSLMSFHSARSALFPYTTLFRSVIAAALLRPEGPAIPVAERVGVLQLAEIVEHRHRGFLVLLALGDALGVEERGQHRSEEHTSELQSHSDIVCGLLLVKKKAANN